MDAVVVAAAGGAVQASGVESVHEEVVASVFVEQFE
jgi:hypothetical protein